MRKYLTTLEDETTPRSIEEYLGAFTESLKLILQQNPVERMGHAVLLAAKTSLRLKAANPKLREYEIAHQLQKIARNIRITTILNDLTPEEKKFLNEVPDLQLDGILKQSLPLLKKRTPATKVKKAVKKKTSNIKPGNKK